MQQQLGPDKVKNCAAYYRNHIPGEVWDSWLCVRIGPRLCAFVYRPFCGLKGLVFFLAEEHKTALCVSVISLPGLAAKLASEAPSVELALRSQCHTEKTAFQTTACVCEWLCAPMTACIFECVCLCAFSRHILQFRAVQCGH